ncbi:hypothetical protein L6164_007562 [Bauhinia variegata]|uniref:Uncharacterized protein n=1 Tax=Bauhinia variegata TaxID=167791 RepID=A0ACB9PFH9_BAUVA|nr:hypothetical protein L6164_007562 [Bauhinia variegata]
MSAKVMKRMKEENPELQKHIGCTHGFFQLFDRHRFLTGQRNSSHSLNSFTPVGKNNDTREQNGTTQKASVKNQKVSREKQQFSTESSRTSMSSSSRSSSMSSHEFSRIVQIEPPSITQTRFPETPISASAAAMKQFDKRSQHSLYLRDIVKDSMHRENKGLSVKTVARKEKGHRTLKYIDSPRPFQSPKSVSNGVMAANESLHALSRSQKTSWDSPRLSYDGRDAQDTFKSIMKHKELPRLSLDSKERSIRGLNEGTKSRNLLKGQQRGHGSSCTSLESLDHLQEPETSRRSSSVIAKLMGLEAFPDQAQTCEKNESSAARSTVNDECKQRQSSRTPRTCKEEYTVESRMADSNMNVTPYSRFSLEPSPWKRSNAIQSSDFPASKGMESSPRDSKSNTVYGEIEKRLAELEFRKSGKDLRALKQILEAMQRYKDSLNLTGDQASNSSSGTRNDSSLSESSTVESPRNIQKKGPISVTVETSNSSLGDKLPIVVMKPAKGTRKTNNPISPAGRLVDKQTAKCITPSTKHLKDPIIQPNCSAANKSNNLRTSKMIQSSKVSQNINGENATSSSNRSGTKSPRSQLEKFGVERRSRPTSPSSDSNINIRQNNRQSIESSFPSTTSRLKFSTSQEGIERLSKTNGHQKSFKKNVPAISPDFDSQKIIDKEVIHINESDKNTSRLHVLNQNNGTKEMSKYIPMVETTAVIAEHPSPVSVLDTAFYREDPPSPVKKRIDSPQDSDEALSVEEKENSVDLSHLSNTTNAQFCRAANDRDSKTKHLIQMLSHIECTLEEPINLNEPHWNIKDPDHKYISEILLASGLLSGPISSQTIHSLGHPINPRLFPALEQIKTTKGVSNIGGSNKKIVKTSNPEQTRRKLIFDVVNDILVQKLALETSSQWFQPNKLTGRKPWGEQLLNELCSEIDQLQCNKSNSSLADEDENLRSLLQGDPMLHQTIWTNCYSEISDIVLDVERMIFKDLITDIVRDEAANHLGRLCRKLLFPK